jgi:hypothetical protein
MATGAEVHPLAGEIDMMLDSSVHLKPGDRRPTMP